MFIYAGCLGLILVCTTAIFRKREGRSLPQQSHDYSDFIRRNRAKQEVLSRAKLAVLLVCIFIFVQGPYILLCFTFEIFSSSLTNTDLDIPQDVDTLITWLKFLFPLLSPIAILCWCSDISGSVKELFLCRSYDPPMIGSNIIGYKGKLATINTREPTLPTPMVYHDKLTPDQGIQKMIVLTMHGSGTKCYDIGGNTGRSAVEATILWRYSIYEQLFATTCGCSSILASVRLLTDTSDFLH
ncbi:hypothetical protein OSTOST_00012 [Ostertagia ostertagi]